MRGIKAVVMVVGGVLALALVAMLALVLLVNPNDYKPRIEQEARAQGIDLTLAGDIGWAFWPRPGFSIRDMTAGIPTGQGKQTVKVGDMRLSLDLPALLGGTVKVGRLTVTDASATLPANQPSGVPISVLVQKADLAGANADGQPFTADVTLQATQAARTVDVSLVTTLAVNATEKHYALQDGTVHVVLTGEGVQPALRTVNLKWGQAQFNGMAGTLSVSGLALDAGPVKLLTQVNGTALQSAAPQVTLEPVTLQLADAVLNGKLAYNAGPAPWLTVALQVDKLDVDALQAALQGATASDGQPAQGDNTTALAPTNEGKAAPDSTGDEPLALAGVVSMPGDYQLEVGQLVANHLHWQGVRVGAQVKNHQLELREFSAKGYDGQIMATGSLQAPPSGRPVLTLNTTVEGLQLPAFLQDLQQQPSKVAAGRFRLESRIQTSPLTRQQLLSTLNGQARFGIDGLVIDELNIEQRVCEAAAKAEGKSLPAKAWPEKTAFREASGDARITNGVVNLSPVKARLDTLDVRGEGPINLAQQTVDLPLDLTLVDERSAANFCEVMNPRLAEVTWPLRCQGNYATQSGKELCGIDKERLDELLRQVAQKKLEQKVDEKLKEKFGGEADKIKEGLRNLFGR